jgi:hypothetical protein
MYPFNWMHRYDMGITYIMDSKSLSSADQLAYTTGDMQRVGIQLYADERNFRDRFWVDQGSGGRNNTGRPDDRNGQSE